MIAAFFSTATLHAQVNQGNLSAAGIFPLALVLEGALHAGDAGAWRPDWPFELPPDAFTVLAGEISRARIVGEGYTLNLAFNSDGRVEEFPFMLNGRMTQVSLAYNDAMEIRELTIAFHSTEEDPWFIEFLEHRDSFPVLARGFRMNAWYFIYITWGLDEILETWYDVEGNLLGIYSFLLANIGQDRRIRVVQDFSAPDGNIEFHFDSRGLLTDISGTNGFFRALYFREDLPRFWERRPVAGDSLGAGNFSLQWDVNGVLLRITGGPQINFQYEYTFDERGNWIERREIRMIRSLGHFVPTQGTVFRRVLEYKDPR